MMQGASGVSHIAANSDRPKLVCAESNGGAHAGQRPGQIFIAGWDWRAESTCGANVAVTAGARAETFQARRPTPRGAD